VRTSAVIEDIRPVLKELDARVERSELHHRNSFASISPALAGLESRLAASALSLHGVSNAEVSLSLSLSLFLSLSLRKSTYI